MCSRCRKGRVPADWLRKASPRILILLLSQVPEGPSPLPQGPGAGTGMGTPSCQDVWPLLPHHPTRSKLPHRFPWAGLQIWASHPSRLNAYMAPASFLVRTLMSLGVAWSPQSETTGRVTNCNSGV